MCSVRSCHGTNKALPPLACLLSTRPLWPALFARSPSYLYVASLKLFFEGTKLGRPQKGAWLILLSTSISSPKLPRGHPRMPRYRTEAAPARADSSILGGLRAAG